MKRIILYGILFIFVSFWDFATFGILIAMPSIGTSHFGLSFFFFICFPLDSDMFLAEWKPTLLRLYGRTERLSAARFRRNIRRSNRISVLGSGFRRAM